ncbi:unnamed protein product [Didymodactylos carnosus]|uniref:Endonuclease/exonuclease/phosphatase domain-containing protein n=1 Tax=Didymodactylos carnosus TaxID=1234261 RepID=A0A814HIM1_9BILA|nr:unnamed protein product [Didymodactylos carnosus]CAF3781810.1 unnamed protein product [Didymodactylos carnosus]
MNTYRKQGLQNDQKQFGHLMQGNILSPTPSNSTDEDDGNSIKMSSQPSPETTAIRQNRNTANTTVLGQRTLTTVSQSTLNDLAQGDDEAFHVVHHQRRRLQPREAQNEQFFDATTSPYLPTSIARQFIVELKRRNIRTRNLVSFWRIDSTKKYLFVYGDNREAFSQLLMNDTYPSSINDQQFNVDQPKSIPPQMSVLAMGVSCQLSEVEVLADVQEQYASADVVLFGCPASSRTRNVKVNFRDSRDYTKCLNNGFIYVNHLKLIVKRYLGTPRVMLCSKCQGYGHFRAKCTSAHEYCAVCSAERSLDSPHVCTNVTNYRRELIEQLLEKDMIPNHVHIPKAFRSHLNRVFPLTPAQNRVTSNVKQQVNRKVSPAKSSSVRQAQLLTYANVLNGTNSGEDSPIRSCNVEDHMQHYQQQLSDINKAHVDTMLNLSNQINMLSAKVDCVSSKVEQMNHLVSKVVIPCVSTLADSLVKLNEKLSCMEVCLGSVSIQVAACYAPRSSDLPLSSLRSVCSNTPCQLPGDFNAYSDLWGCASTDSRGRQLEQFIEELNLNVSATEVTSKRATTSINVIDLVITSYPNPYTSVLK